MCIRDRKRHLAEEGFEPSLGARPLRRVIQRTLEDPLSEAILVGEFQDGDTILCDYVEGKAQFRHDETVSEAPSELPPAEVAN